jgi:hypothetical protein
MQSHFVVKLKVVWPWWHKPVMAALLFGVRWLPRCVIVVPAWWFLEFYGPFVAKRAAYRD